ncbi:esterase [Lithospermum erythrorhizon]|uniref:Esterase n=1 Tax=Lithospermum erythrorhizon TaxID=34254 RepID=A0AAV3P520_LITER
MEDSWLHMNKHIVLVHGTGHGAWCWYKLKPLLEAAGHQVTAVELSASGIDPKQIQEVHTFNDYTLPLLELMESVPADEKVILVGHSLGGMNIALAMEKYPHKVSIGVFVSAFVPDTTHAPSYVLEKYLEQIPAGAWGDTKLFSVGSPGREPLAVMSFGPKALENALYQLCPPEDLVLAKMLVRPGSLFLEDLSMANKFSKEGFGSVKRVYVINNKDRAIPEEFQRWLVANMGVIDFKEIKDADHMSMLSRPQELCKCLLDFNRI